MSVDCKAKYRCKDCFYCIIYDDCARCHMGKPTVSSGFPKVNIDLFCGYFTHPETMERPYYMPPSLPPPPPADV